MSAHEPVPDVTPEVPGLGWRSTLAMLQRLPQGGLSRAFGLLADVPLPRALRPIVLGGFARAAGIDVTEAELPLTEYASLNRFFVRRMRPGLRTWPADARVAGSPVDGVVGRFGRIRSGTLVQAKGRTYSAADLLGSADDAVRYDGGSFLTLYLSPRHYHRIHAPCTGVIRHARHVPGALLPVNAPAVMHVDRLFPRNERLLCTIEGDVGHVTVVAVGAYNVGRISAAFDETWGDAGWVTNRARVSTTEERRYATPLPIARGDELMAFHLGSTVVLLFETRARLNAGLVAGAEIRLGAPIAAAA